MKGLVLSLLLFNLNSTKAQTFEDFFGVDSNEIHYKYWLLKNYYSFDSVIKYHSIQQRDDLNAFEDSLDINVYLENNKLTVFAKEELMLSILWMKNQLIVNERGLIYEFRHRQKTIKWIKIWDEDKETKVRFKDGKILAISKGFECEKNNVSEEFLNQMELKFNQ